MLHPPQETIFRGSAQIHRRARIDFPHSRKLSGSLRGGIGRSGGVSGNSETFLTQAVNNAASLVLTSERIEYRQPSFYVTKEIAISLTYLERVSHEESRGYVDVAQKSIRDASEYHIPKPAFHETKNFDD